MQKKPHTYNSINYLLINCISAVLSILAASYSLNNMNNPLHLMITVFQIPGDKIGLYEGLLQCSIYIGAFMGSLLGTQILHMGNRKCFYIVDILMICGSSLLFIDEIHIFLIGRVISGMGCGLAPSVTSYYLKQFIPVEIYGILAGLNPTLQLIFKKKTSLSIGLLIAQIMGLFIQKNVQFLFEVNNYWRYYFTVFPILICLTRICLLSFVLKYDTPLHYVMNNDHQKAIQVLNKTFQKEYVPEILEQIELDSHTQKHKKSIMSKPYARRFYFGLFLQLLTANSGYNVILHYSTDIFNDIFSEGTAQVLTLMVAVIKFSLYTICFTLSQRYGSSYIYNQGRRKLFISGNFVMLCMNFSIGFLSLTLANKELDSATIRYLQYIIVVFIYIYFIATFLSLPPLINIYLPEILPSYGVQYTWVVYWASQMYILLLFPIIKQSIGLSYCFFYFGTFNMVGQVIIHYYLFETKNATQKMIEDFYYSKAKVQIQDSSTLQSSIFQSRTFLSE